MVGTARCAVPARRAGGICAENRSTALIAPLDAALTAQRAIPTETGPQKSLWSIGEHDEIGGIEKRVGEK
jgi:hypothetical protein